MKINLRKKYILFVSVMLLMITAGCSITPDIQAPQPVLAPVEENKETQAKKTDETPAESSSKSKSDISDVVIVTEDYPPYNFINEKGELDGIGYSHVKMGLDKLGLDTEIQVLPWARAYEMVQNQDNVLIFSMTMSDARKDMFKWISAVAQQDVYLYALKDRAGELKINSLEDAKKYVISAMNDDYTHLSLLEAGFEDGVNISSTPDMGMAATQILRGQTDLFITGSGLDDIEELVSGSEYSAKDLEVIYTVDEMKSYMYLAASMETSDEIVEKFREAIPGIDTEE